MKILRTLDPGSLLFFDIETARVVKDLEIDTPLFDSWKYKKRKEGITDNDELIKTYEDEAGLYPEFSKIICIVAGYIVGDELVTKRYNNSSEKVLLEEFNNDTGSFLGAIKKSMLCGFANKGFDTPFIQKRMIINKIEENDCFDTFDSKPWILDSVDLADLWKGSSWNRASLLNVVTALGLPSPKSDIAGYQVGGVYWNDGPEGLERITKYCEQDVLAVANVFRAIRFEEPLTLREGVEAPKIEELPLIVSINNGGKFGAPEKKQLEKIIDGLEKEEQKNAVLILEAMNKKKRTKITQVYLDKIKKRYE